jgi:hypothetical protein
MMKRRTILIAGLLTYVVAWFLPVLTFGTTLASGRLPGWEALRLALVPIVPYQGFTSGMSWGSAFYVLSGLTNLLMVGGAFILLRATGPAPRCLPTLLAAAAVLNTWWYFDGTLRTDLLIGYYTWVLSFFIVALASRLGVRGPKRTPAH